MARCPDCHKEIKKKSKDHKDAFFCDNCQIYFADMEENKEVNLIRPE